jgi:anti-anti-sigma regulatory factor
MAGEAMSETVADLFAIDREGETVIVTPLADLGALAYPQLEAGANELLGLLDHAPARNLVLDFHRGAYDGSTVLPFFLKLWMRVSQQSGRVAVCNVSDHEKDILRITQLDRLWPVCGSRGEALEAVRPSAAHGRR